MSDFIKILSDNFDKIFGYITELILVIFEPRKYFRIINNESLKDTILRLITYGILFELINISLLQTLITEKIPTNYLNIAGYMIMDGIQGIIYFPALLIGLKLNKIKIKWKTIITFIYSYRFYLLIIGMVFYALFITSENYIFAIFRGMAVYSYRFLLLLIFTYLFASSLKKRILLFIYTFIMVAIIESFSIITLNESGYNIVFSMLNDPIGVEVENSINEIGRFNLVNSQIFLNKYFYPSEIDSSGKDFTIRREEWNDNKENYLKSILVKKKFIDSLKISRKFNTTRYYLNLKSQESDLALKYFKSIDLLFSDVEKGDDKEIVTNIRTEKMVKRFSELIEANIKFQIEINKFQDMRKELYNFRLIN